MENQYNMKTVKIYTAGAVRETAYREFVHKVYGDNPKIELIDPLLIVKQIFPQVVEEDKRYIRECDVLVAFVEEPSFGTVMEIIYAYEQGKPVYIINPNKKHECNFWIKYHATKTYYSISECFDEILQKI